METFSFLPCGLVCLAATACLAPPPEAVAAAKSAPEGSESSVPEPSGGPPPADDKAAPDPSKPLVVWNGDDVNPTSKGWSDCDTKPCVSTLEPTAKSGSKDSMGLEFRVDISKGWAGFGWNFTSWYAPAAADATGRKTLKVMLKITAENADLAPAVDALQIGLRCAKTKQCNAGLQNLKKYEPKIADGQWHELSIPLGDMKPEKGSIWDPGSVWELNLSQWAPTPKKFVMAVDDIRLE
jgi:hypothetical protein